MLRKVRDDSKSNTVFFSRLLATWILPEESGAPFSENSRLLPSSQDLEVAAEFSITNGLTSLLEALKKRNYAKVREETHRYSLSKCSALIGGDARKRAIIVMFYP